MTATRARPSEAALVAVTRVDLFRATPRRDNAAGRPR